MRQGLMRAGCRRPQRHVAFDTAPPSLLSFLRLWRQNRCALCHSVLAREHSHAHSARMNFFQSSRLANGAGRVGVIAPLVPTDYSANEAANQAARSKSKAAADEVKAAGLKRKRATADALFAEESNDDEEEEEEPSHRPSKASASRKAPPQPPQSKHRPSKHLASDDEDDDPEDDDEDGAAAASSSSSSKPSAPKKSRTAPEELSSKKQVAAGLVVTALPKLNLEKRRRDPRFDPLCGDFDPLHFDANYKFINEEKQAEIKTWQAELKSGRSSDGSRRLLDDEEREEIRARIQRAQQSLQSQKRTVGESSLLKTWKASERKAQRETGKKPFHLKASEVKKLQLASRYLELKSNKGALQKFMTKKNKENANRDHKYMPHEGRE